MKKITISNGEVRMGYELSELSEDAKSKVIFEHEEFLRTYPPSIEDEGGELTTDYDYQPTEEEVIDSIEINEYLYDESGDMLPLLYYTGNHPQAGRITYRIAGKEYDCKIDSIN